jgi:lipopolysaccharide biosynthesis protein
MARLLAIYLPQFHPIPENDAWWGQGFTEWTNVTKARPLFPGHYQPHLPADLGFYDLRLPEVRQAQADLARAYGVNGFVYFHYWFNGKLLLERPLQEVLESGKPDFPFCICWANENWTRAWNGAEQDVLMRQEYSAEDDRAHIRWLLPYLKDPRYIKVRGKPVLMIYRGTLLPDLARTVQMWRDEAVRAGLPGLYLMRTESNFRTETGDIAGTGLDATAEFQPRGVTAPKLWWVKNRVLRRVEWHWYRKNIIFDYRDLVSVSLNRPPVEFPRYPCVTPGWDNSSRRAPRGLQSTLWINSTPERYEGWLRDTLRKFRPFGEDEDFVFVNAWNEWAEGNHLEPDQKYGRAYLEATLRALRDTGNHGK